jgi:hypothetical protein
MENSISRSCGNKSMSLGNTPGLSQTIGIESMSLITLEDSRHKIINLGPSSYLARLSSSNVGWWE